MAKKEFLLKNENAYYSIDGSRVTREEEILRIPTSWGIREIEIMGRWVYRDRLGKYIDHDVYRNDLAERHNLKLQGV